LKSFELFFAYHELALITIIGVFLHIDYIYLASILIYRGKNMGQLNVYVPDELEEIVKKEAKKEGKSVSAFVLEAIKKIVRPVGWSKEFLATFGSWEGEFPEIKDLPPQKRSSLDSL
jgi:hypothetical protein